MTTTNQIEYPSTENLIESKTYSNSTKNHSIAQQQIVHSNSVLESTKPSWVFINLSSFDQENWVDIHTYLQQENLKFNSKKFKTTLKN